MKVGQKYTPKYWVLHDITSDDVLFWTMHKNKVSCILEYDENNEVSFEEDEDLDCILIEIREVKV
mgnify:CR=1 FL=1